MNQDMKRPLRKDILQIYHIIISGMFVIAFKMSMKAKFATSKFGTVRRVLNRMSKRQMMALPTIDPIITTVIKTIRMSMYSSRQSLVETGVLFIVFLGSSVFD